MLSSSRHTLMQGLFLALEGLVYARFLFLDLTGRGAAGNGLKYLGIVLCAVFAWYQARGGGSRLMAWALTLTLGADFFLLMLDRYYILGLLLFCAVQGLYLLRIARANGGRTLWTARLVLCLLSPALLAALGRLTGENLLAPDLLFQLSVQRGPGGQTAPGLGAAVCPWAGSVSMLRRMRRDFPVPRPAPANLRALRQPGHVAVLSPRPGAHRPVRPQSPRNEVPL